MINKLALGAAQFGLDYGIANRKGIVPKHEVVNILYTAYQNGIDIIDTASVYGNSEQLLGDIGTDRFKIITKLPKYNRHYPDPESWVFSQFQTSLVKLRRDSIYGLLIHQVSELKEDYWPGISRALQRLKLDGLVNKIGVSVYSPKDIEISINAMPVDLVQAPFNLIDRRIHESGWLDRLYHRGVEVHVRSVFLQGLLLMNYPNIPEYFKPWGIIFEEWNSWLDNNGITSTQACLAYTLSFPQISRIVVGVDNNEQMRNLIEASGTSHILNFPTISNSDERLINPSTWDN